MNPQGSRKHPIHKQDFLSRLAYPNVGKTRFSIPFKAQCWQGCGFYVGDKWRLEMTACISTMTAVRSKSWNEARTPSPFPQIPRIEWSFHEQASYLSATDAAFMLSNNIRVWVFGKDLHDTNLVYECFWHQGFVIHIPRVLGQSRTLDEDGRLIEVILHIDCKLGVYF